MPHRQIVSAAKRQPHYAVTGEPLVSARHRTGFRWAATAASRGVLKMSMPQRSAARFAEPTKGIGSDSTDPSFVIRRQAQLLIAYADSPIVGTERRPHARRQGADRPGGQRPMRLYSPPDADTAGACCP